MLVVMQADATDAQVDAVCDAIRAMGFEPAPMPGAQRTAVGLVGNDGQVDGSHIERHAGRRRGDPRVEAVQAGLARVAAGEHARGDRARRRASADATSSIIAGPCSVESEEQILTSAQRSVRAGGAARCAAARSSRVARPTRSRAWARRGSSCSRSRERRRASRSSPRRWTRRARTSSPSTPTASRSARATCRTTRCCASSGSSASRCCSSAAWRRRSTTCC